ncbi:hypothetical protein AVEN_141327-1, partial [Araneus ventricosus]
GGGDAAP